MAKKSSKKKQAGIQRSGAYQFLFVLSILLLGAAFAVTGHLLMQEQEQTRLAANKRVDGELGGAFALGVDTLVMPLVGQVEYIATSDATKAILGSGDWRKVRLLERKVSQGIQHLISLRIFPYSTAKLNQDHEPPIKHATMEVIAAAELKKDTAAEVQFVDDKRILVIVKAIELDPSAVTAAGTVVMFLDFEAMLEELPSLDRVSGYVRWIQKVGSSSSRNLLEIGDPRLQGPQPTWSKSLENRNWTIEVHSNLSAPIAWEGNFELMLLAAVASSSLVLLLIAWGIAFREEKKNLEEELRGGSFGFVAQSAGQMAVHAHKEAHVDADERNVAIDTFGQSGGALSESLFDVEVLDDDGLGLLDTVEEVDPSAGKPLQLEKCNPEIFGRSYIRGKCPQEVTIETARVIGLAVGTLVIESGGDTVIVGRDNRETSEALSQSLVQGLIETGCQVVLLGQVTTGVVYFATEVSQARSGVMITGGHGGRHDNGFKIIHDRKPMTGEELLQMRLRMDKGDVLHGQQGDSAEQDVSGAYVQKLQSTIQVSRSLKVLVDSMNGVSGPLIEDALMGIGAEVEVINREPDPAFPKGVPDPLESIRLSELQMAIQKGGHDIGFAVDAAGERLVVVTPQGKIVWPDRIMAFLAQELLSMNPGKEVILDVKCGRALLEAIVAGGGKPVMWKSGYPNIKSKMSETGAVLGGEFAGHIAFNEPGRWYSFDDSIYTMCRLIELISMQSQDVDTVFDQFPEKPSTPELIAPIAHEVKMKVVKELQEPERFPAARLNTVDGVRIDLPQAWAAVRFAERGDFLSMRFEADSDAELNKLKQQVEEHISQIAS